jgi:hypothetical protein
MLIVDMWLIGNINSLHFHSLVTPLKDLRFEGVNLG